MMVRSKLPDAGVAVQPSELDADDPPFDDPFDDDPEFCDPPDVFPFVEPLPVEPLDCPLPPDDWAGACAPCPTPPPVDDASEPQPATNTRSTHVVRRNITTSTLRYHGAGGVPWKTAVLRRQTTAFQCRCARSAKHDSPRWIIFAVNGAVAVTPPRG
jgi:hypothetical protein